jgi:hypothetical protein
MALKTPAQPIEHAQDPSCREGEVKKILFLASNPRDTAPLRLNEEIREIQEGLRRSKYREHFEIHSLWAVRFKDLRRALLDIEPHIVHFSGYGGENGLLLENETGYAASVTAKVIAELFAFFTNTIECAIFTAGYCKQQAEAVNTAIKYVIAMPDEILEQKTIEFVLGFYDALGAGKTIEQAFNFGRNAMMTFERPSFLVNPDIPLPTFGEHLPDREKKTSKRGADDPKEEPWIQLRHQMHQMYKTSVYGECSLETIFVESQLTSHLPNTELKISEIEKANALELLEDFVFKRNRFAGEDHTKLPAVLFGDYGSGKSSTLRILAARLGERKNTPFPIFVPLREAILRNTDNLFESIEEYLLLNYNIKNLKEELHQRPICWLLDGFDELNMIEADGTNWIYERYKEIERLAKISHSTVILSSRPILFLGKPSNIAENTVRFSMQLFNESRVQEWITKWLTLPQHKNSSLTINGLKARNLFLECRNPLILFMVASLFDDELKKEKPYLRAEIFKTFIDSTESGKFYREKDHRYMQPMPGNYRKVLQEIAYTIFRYGEAGLISKSNLVRYLPTCENMEGILKKRHLRSLLVGHFFREAKTAKIESYIEFSHQSFREYLVVEKLVDLLLKTSDGNFNAADWSNLCIKMLTGEKMGFLMEALCLLRGEERIRIFNKIKLYALDSGGIEKQLDKCHNHDISEILKSIHFTSTIRKIISYYICAVIACNGSDSLRAKLNFGTKSVLINIYHACHSYPHLSTIKNAWDLLINQLPGGILGPKFQWSGFDPVSKTFGDYAVLNPMSNTIVLTCQYMIYVLMDLKDYHILHLGTSQASFCVFRGGNLLLADKNTKFDHCVFINCRIIGLHDDTRMETNNCSFERATFINLHRCNEKERSARHCEKSAQRAVEILTDYSKKMECSPFVPWGGVVADRFPEFEKIMFNTPTDASVLSQSNLCRINAMAME